MKIRNFQPEDIDYVIDLWKKADIFYEPWDRKENLLKKHVFNPDLFLVAEENNSIVGVVIGQYDGWGSYIHHLATKDNYGTIAEVLLSEIEKKLKEKGVKTVFSFTFPKSKESEFVQKQNYKDWGLSEGWEKFL